MDTFKKYLQQWSLTPDGEAIITPSSKLLPVRYKERPAMLKIALSSEEQLGGKLMLWWDGERAAPIWAHDDIAFLMERALGKQSLKSMVAASEDDEASRILCSVANRLHKIKNKPLPSTLSLRPLSSWFKSLELAAAQQGGIFNKAYATALALLNKPEEVIVLHGDIHHGNVLDFGEDGWLAIDPKGILGPRVFDFANIFCNPDEETVLKPGRFMRQVAVVAEAAGLEPAYLVQWIFAYAALSAAWHIEDTTSPKLALSVAEIAFAVMNTP